MIDAPHDDPRMLKREILEAIRLATEDLPWLLSVTLAGSFSTGDSLEGVSDIDLIVVAETLSAARLSDLQAAYRTRLTEVLGAHGWELYINMTLGPLKFNRDRLAVLHLMPYTVEGHIQHAIDSPFTCLDWQNSPIVHRKSLREIYPVFGLQPRHFLSARRGLNDYLGNLQAGVISWREIVGEADGIREVAHYRPMDDRDRIEFAWHILKFTMRNVLKFLLHTNEVPSGDALVTLYFDHLPNGYDEILPFYRRLEERKRGSDFSTPFDDLVEKLAIFLMNAQDVLGTALDVGTTQFDVLRHAKPAGSRDGPVRFLGRSDPDLPDAPLPVLTLPIRRVESSPMLRCMETARRLGLRVNFREPRLIEIDYGRAEGMTFAELQESFPDIVEAWQRGEDPRFPGGENTNDVRERVLHYFNDPKTDMHATVITHNVVIRCMLGMALNIPQHQWHRLTVPYVSPMRFRHHPALGLFVDLEPALQREIFAQFKYSPRS